jgi:hypothetical protein
VALLAAAGETVTLITDSRADATGSSLARLLGARDDLAPDLGAARALIHGQPAQPWFGDFNHSYPDTHQNVGHAPQYVVLLAPLAVLPAALATSLARVVGLLLACASLIAWARMSMHSLPSWLWLFPLSAPVVTLVRLDQLMTAVGLAGLTFAVLMQRRDRWFLVGVGCALGLVRTTNALPLLAVILVAGWGRPRQLAVALLGAATFFAPLTLVVQLWDATWVRDYAHNLNMYALYQSPGVVKALRDTFGVAGQIGAAFAAAAAAAALVWRDRGRAIDPDRAALAMSISVVSTIVSAIYVAIFALPALIRVALRRHYTAVAAIAAAGPWVIIVATAPLVLATPPLFPATLLSIMSLGLVALAYPLFRRVQSSPVPR